MDIFFSPSVHAFFTPALHGEAMPADAVAISGEEHRALIEGQSQGRAIACDDDGRPCLAPVPRVTLAQLRARAVARTKREAARRIEAIAPLWQQLNDSRAHPQLPEVEARFAAIDAVRAASNAIETKIAGLSAASLAALDIANHPLWPSE